MRIFIRLFIVLLLAGWAQFVFAIDYSWTISVSGYTGRGPSPKAALEKFCAVHPSYGPGGYCEPSRHTLIRFDDATWQVRFFFTDGREAGRHNIIRSGDSCPSGTSYNSLTGECEGDKCEVTAGNIIYHEFSFASIGPDSNPSQDPPITVCQNLCQYSHTYDGYTFKSKRDFTPPDKIVGSFKYKGNGTSCTPSASDPSVFDQPPSKEPVTTPPESKQKNTCDQWVTNPDGTASRSCTSVKEFKEPGTLDCTGMTAAHCKPVNPSPDYNKTESSETTKETSNPDGSKTTETDKTTHITVCKGVSPCTTTSKTETATSQTDAQGNPANQSSECVGTACDDGSTTGDEGENEEEEEVPNEGSSSGNCDSEPTYSGDPLLGSILKQQWHTMCAGDELKAVDLAAGLELEGLVDADTLDNVLADDATTVDSEVRSAISGVYTSGPSSSCPLQDASISTRWGVITLPWTMNCPIFNVISAVIFFFSYLAAGWILFNALARND